MLSTLRPWDTWDLDRNFLNDITRWTDNHPENRLDCVLDNICTVIDAGKDFLDLIPDNPFPARSLIQGLGQLIKVGTAISKAKGDVHAFSKDIVDWVSRIAAAFKHDHSGRFTSRTWDDLGKMRDLINEICTWANKRLNDKGLKRIRHGRTIGKEIGEFKSRFTDGTQLFMQLCMINLAQGNDALLEHAEQLAQSNDTIRKEIEPLGPAVSFVHDRAAKQELIDDITSRLSPRIATNFSYVDQGRACCDPETRIEILGKIEKWAYDTSDDSPRLFWLTGVPGAGKSSISASIAGIFGDRNCLGAQFFISRNHFSTTDPNRIFPSIAHQLAELHPKAALAIHAALQKQKSLVHTITDRQAAELFVEPIKVASDLHPSNQTIIVIDALDEIEGEVSETAKILSKAIPALPRNAKVLISSRPEQGIQMHFAPMVSNNRAAHLDLDTSNSLSIKDVAKFFRSEIKKILSNNQLEEQWPGEERMQTLCDRASGLFIWAVTAIKYIRTRIAAFGSQCLDEVIRDLNTGGKDGINDLYHAILRRTCAGDEGGRESEAFRRIVGAIVVLKEPLALVGLRGLLDLYMAGTNCPIDLKHFIGRFRSVLVVGAGVIDDTAVPRLHKSFVEFITKDCEDCFRVNAATASEALAIQCFGQLNDLRRDMCEIQPLAKFNADIPNLSSRIERNLSRPFRYACRFWAIHLSEGRGDGARQLFRDFFYRHLLHWVEVMSLLDYNSVFSLLERAADWEYSNHHDDEGDRMLVNDAMLFVKMFSEPIAKSAPHTYISALSFAPKSSWIYKHYHPVSGCTINVLGGALEEWPQYIWQSRGHDSVTSVAFSPDGKQIVSGSHDCTICLWDAASGQLVGSPLKGYSDPVKSVAFSPDGTNIVAHYDDGTVDSWNLATGKIDLSTDTKLGFLMMQDGWVCDASDKSLLYWIPEHSWSADVWASSGAKLVIGHRTGRVTIIDATAVFQSCRIPV